MALLQGMKNIVQSLIDTWGRSADKEDYYGDRPWPPQTNPDPTTEDIRFDSSMVPVIKAGEQYTDVARLYVSAKGLSEEENGAEFPAQLVYTSPGGDAEVMAALATQYDELFEGGFQPILRSLDNPTKNEGYCIAEIEWYLKEDNPYKGKMFARFVWSRDPRDYIFDYEGEEGIYKDDDFTSPEKMSPTSFLSYAHDPLYNNKYGNAKNRPLQPWLTTWVEVFDSWRKGLEHAGYGFVVGKYATKYAANGADAIQWRANYLKQVLAFGAGKGGIIENGNELELQQIKMDAGIFLEWYTEMKKDVSMLYTGSETGLTEGQYGTYAGKESTEVRERSYIEMMNAARVCGFWTEKFNRLWCEINFPPERIKVIPTLRLIPPELVVPTTPKDQEEIDQRDGVIKPAEDIDKPMPEKEKELAAPEEETESGQPPVAIPVGYKDFPRDTPTPEPYKDVTSAAEVYLAAMPVKNYKEFQPKDGGTVFTIKRQHSFEASTELLEALKMAIVPTLSAPDEKAAWLEYYESAKNILEHFGITMDTGIRDDLNISFRQARQTAFSRALVAFGQQDGAIGLKFNNLKDGHDIRTEHKLWDGVVLAFDHPRFEEILTPSDFGCICWNSLVYAQDELTPESEIPIILMGDTYKYYAQPE